MTPPGPSGPESLLDELPQDLMIWILIFSELLAFGAGLAAFLALRILRPEEFAAGTEALHQGSAALNTAILVTSGWWAARAVVARGFAATRLFALAALGGALFLLLKGLEWKALAAQGLGLESSAFFTFYYLLTGFHAAHVLAGICVLLIVAWRPVAAERVAAAAFWHMVDLIWVLLFPVLYLLG